MAQRVEALVEPTVLVWAREKAGLTIDVAARKAGVSPDRLAAWERGELRPSVPQARELGRVYKRSLSVFYLPRPPRDFPPIKDYRLAWEREHEPPAPELLDEIRAAYERREIALELLGEADAPEFGLHADVDENPDDVARRIRRTLGVDYDDQEAWQDSREGFNAWRAAIESQGVLVSQMVGVEQGQARGFSIDERPLPVIVANNRDPLGRGHSP